MARRRGVWRVTESPLQVSITITRAGSRRACAAFVTTVLLFTLITKAPVAVAADTATSSSDWLGRINEIRAASQLAPVVEEPAWTAGIRAHFLYMLKTPSSYMTGQYASLHTENPASPYYTAAGAIEAESSDIGAGATNVEAIDNWLAAPFHAVGMLRPGLTRVAFARDPKTYTAALDVIRGLEPNAPAQLVLFPGPDSTIDLNRYESESPSPLETCEAEHPGADYREAGLPMIALLTERPTAELSAALTLPDGQQIGSTSEELCVVDATDFVTTDGVYGPAGEDVLDYDNAVFLIPRLPLIGGTYTAKISEPGRPEIAWSFGVRPKPEEVSLLPHLGLHARRSLVRFYPGHALIGRKVMLSITRGWVPCAVVLHAHPCTWVRKGPVQRRTLRVFRGTAIHIRPPGRWETVFVEARTSAFSSESQHYSAAMTAVLLRGPKPHHTAH